jgi:nucleotide-binding universal stress UspA family protein/nitrite reductase/ring-hydroxylating ferredoxin subunit
MSYKRIVLATDGSPSAETAEHVGVTLARSVKGTLAIAHAYEHPDRVAGAVARALSIAEREGVKAEVIASADPPDEAIIEIADRYEAELLVMGSRGFYKAEQVIGNIVRKVATHAPCDVLLTRERAEEDRPHGAIPYRQIMIATDGSATADRAARKGYALAKRLKATVTLCFVGHPKTGELVLQDTVASIGDPDVTSETVIREGGGDPADEILAAAAKDGSDLIIVGNKGLTGAKAFILGSVPKKVAEFSPIDVIIARTVTQNLSEIGKGEGGIVTSGDAKIAVYRDRKGNVVSLSAKCTHMGCTVKWNPAETTWDCPCHGSRFAPTGEVVQGPAAKPLEKTDL